MTAFNDAFVPARNIVERVIGMLKQRFQVLMKGLRLMDMEDCSKLIQICCALHNYLKEKNVEFEFEWPLFQLPT